MEVDGRGRKRPHLIPGVALIDKDLFCFPGFPPPGVPPTTPDPAPPPVGSQEPLVLPEFAATLRPWSGLDRLGLTQSIGGLVLGLIALFSSYDHITFAGRSVPLQQQWGILFIFASVATVFVDAQLASRSRLRAANAAERMAYETDRDRDLASEERQRADQERNRADQERNRADQERDRAAEARERQAQDAERQNEDLALLRRSALLSARVQLDPNPTHRARLQFFLTLMDQRYLQDPEA